jgi:hypothetical protein
MNKLYIFFLFSVFININANQPPEYNLFFSESQIQNNHVVKLEKNINIERIKIQGLATSVYLVKNLSEFLYIVTKQNRPLIINFYSKDDKNKLEFCQMAEKFNENYTFVSIDSNKNKQLSQLIFLFLRFDGFNENAAELKYPLIFYCLSNSVAVKDGLLHLKKGALKMLLNPGVFSRFELESILNNK